MEHNSTGTNGDPTVKTPYKDDPEYGNGSEVYYKPSGSVNMRKSTSLKAKVLTTIPKGYKTRGNRDSRLLKNYLQKLFWICPSFSS